jgi:hypothetical protein
MKKNKLAAEIWLKKPRMILLLQKLVLKKVR